MKPIKNSIIVMLAAVLLQGCIRDEILLPPVISGFDKNPVASDNVLVISGKYFDPQTTQVFINDTLVATAGTVDLAEIRIYIPVRKISTEAMLQVKTKFGASTKETITILPPAPFIRKVIPDKAGISKQVKVVGNYINTATAVSFKSPNQTESISATFSILSADTLLVIVPAGLSFDAADLRVSTGSGESEPTAFTVLAPPTIAAFTPEQAVVGSIILITGTNLGSVNSSRIGANAVELLSVAANRIEVRVPAGAVSDTLHLNGWGGKTKTTRKVIIAQPPVIASLDKTTGTPGTTVAITGTNFQNAFEVKFGNTPAQIVSNTGTVLNTRVPAGASSGKISVVTPAGMGTSVQEFTVAGAPIISSFLPVSGGVGTKINLTGANLTQVTVARIGLVNLKINNKTDNQMEVEVLTGSVTGKLSVIAGGSTYETTSNFIITGSPQVNAFTPSSGIPGSVVTITGINFPANPDVRFGTSSAAVVTSSSTTEIVCQVPANATTGKINVSGALSAANYTLNVKAVITSISPMQGGVGAEITITGQYLSGATINFSTGRTAEKVGAGSDTQVIVKVPTAAITGKINVVTTGGTTLSASDFQVLAAPTITSFTPVSGGSGTSVTISGTNLQHSPEVRFNNVLATIRSFSATQIVADVPVGAVTGKISVKTTAVSTAVASANNFTVVGNPVITSIVPASGTIKERVTINGTNLSNYTAITFDGVAATVSEIISSTSTSIVVRVPATVNGANARTINVNVSTSANNSNNFAFSLLGTPSITRISPNNNPASWAFLIEGTNLGSVKKITLDGKVPNVGTAGIDKRAFNYLTTKVPDDIKPPSDQNKALVLYYTTDDFGKLDPVNYQVLRVPPPGVYPPPFIILPPPLPVNYVQADISAYWMDKNYFSINPDEAHCFNIRGNFRDASDFANQSGNFCQFQEYYSVNGSYSPVRNWSGNWNKGILTLTSYDDEGNLLELKGQVSGSTLIFTDQNGRQLELAFDSGPCGIINANGCENND